MPGTGVSQRQTVSTSQPVGESPDRSPHQQSFKPHPLHCAPTPQQPRCGVGRQTRATHTEAQYKEGVTHLTHLSRHPSQPTQHVVTQTRTHSHVTVCAFCLAWRSRVGTVRIPHALHACELCCCEVVHAVVIRIVHKVIDGVVARAAAGVPVLGATVGRSLLSRSVRD